MSSEPTWLDDNDTISFDVDSKHMGAFSAAQGRMKVLPELTPKPFVTAFRHVIAGRIYVSTVFDTGEAEFSEIDMPEMKVGAKFRITCRRVRLAIVGVTSVLRECPSRRIR